MPQVILNARPARAVVWVSPTSPNLALLYGALFWRTREAEILPMLIMRPPPCAFMMPKAARVQRNGARRLVAITLSQSSVVILSIGPPLKTPALLTRISSRPKRSLVFLKRLYIFD